MGRRVRYFGDLDLRWDNGSGCWITLHEIGVLWLDDLNQLANFRVAAGFTTDLSSIPSVVPNWVLPKIGRQNLPSAVHDWCYEDKVPDMTRAEADLLFLDGMVATGVAAWRRNIMYAAVRAFGAALWG